jgi:hypothetical protein
MTSDNTYSAGEAYQFDRDDPVRPAETHADKNLEMRSYTLNTDPGLLRDLIDAGFGDDPMPPQLATLFRPYRVPAVSDLYQVHQWAWEDSPDPGSRAEPIDNPPVTALGMRTTPGEVLQVPVSGYNIGGLPETMEVLILYADADTIALRYTREDSSGSAGYTIHVDNLCVDPNLLALYESLDDPDGPRYVYVPLDQRPYHYDLPNLPEGHPIGVARDEEIVVSIVDSGTFMEPRLCHDWWEIRPGYGDDCTPLDTAP